MKKIIIILMSLLIMLPISPVSAANANITIYSPYAYAYDDTSGQVVYNKKGTDRIYPASMTKVMTVYTALRKITDLDATTVVEKADVEKWWAEGASTAGFTPGMTVSYRDLIYGALYPSGADACYILATRTYGSEESFIAAMNANAKKLGMKHTHFTNTVGLHNDDHYSTCADIAKCLAAAYKIPAFKTAFTGRSYHATCNIYFYSVLTRTANRYHVTAPLIAGAKSGYTKNAQHCLCSAMEYQGHHIFIVTAKAVNKVPGVAVADANIISTYINDNYKVATIVKKGETIKKIKINDSKTKQKTIKADEDISLLMAKSDDANTIVKSWQGDSTINAPVKKGEVLGKLVITDDGEKLKTVTYRNDEAIAFSLLPTLARFKYLIIIGALLVLFMIFRRIMIARHRRKKRRSKKKRS